MMVLIFEDHQRIGLVRYEARRAGEELNSILMPTLKPSEAEQISTPQFKEYALNLIDRIFQAK